MQKEAFYPSSCQEVLLSGESKVFLTEDQMPIADNQILLEKWTISISQEQSKRIASSLLDFLNFQNKTYQEAKTSGSVPWK